MTTQSESIREEAERSCYPYSSALFSVDQLGFSRRYATGSHNTSASTSVNNGDISSNPRSNSNNSNEQHGISLYESLPRDMSHDPRIIKEITSSRRIAHYRIRREIGSGSFSMVKLGVHALTKEKVAIKIVDKTKLDAKTLRFLSRETQCMERLHHPNVIRLYEVVETLGKVHIVMEYAQGGELSAKILNEGRMRETDAKIIFAQLVAAVQHMHSYHIVHRDLKAENVFFSSPRLIKVGDFGFSTVCHPKDMLNTSCGSPPYAAPELFGDERYDGVSVDVWALGILLYFIVTGLVPFRAETVMELKRCILLGSYTVPSYISDSCVFLISGILKHIPLDRFNLVEIRRSEWLEGQIFPRANKPYNLNPDFGSDNIKDDDEREAWDVLSSLGIRKEHIDQSGLRNSRNSIAGTYRIVLHQLHKKNTTCLGESSHWEVAQRRKYNKLPIKRRSRNTSMATSGTMVNYYGKGPSKTCLIL